jgi:hypothetical protein
LHAVRREKRKTGRGGEKEVFVVCEGQALLLSFSPCSSLEVDDGRMTLGGSGRALDVDLNDGGIGAAIMAFALRDGGPSRLRARKAPLTSDAHAPCARNGLLT